MRITLVIKAWKKQNKTKQNYKPIYNKQNNTNIYISAIKIWNIDM